jgi:glucosyl-3-phosphoglycerate synthase
MFAGHRTGVKMVLMNPLLVSACLPARNEEGTVGAIVERIAAQDIVDEILVVDDGSTDDTARVAAEAGATVVPTEVRGKGEALWTALGTAKGDLLVFCDADLIDFDPTWVTRLLAPLFGRPDVDFVKARYVKAGLRGLDATICEGGRVTELVARPLISLLFPELAHFSQPLAGEFAARREVLEAVPFVRDYGVDIALLIDVARLVGVDRIVEVDLGVKRHRNRPLAELSVQARQVIQAVLERAP